MSKINMLPEHSHTDTSALDAFVRPVVAAWRANKISHHEVVSCGASLIMSAVMALPESERAERLSAIISFLSGAFSPVIAGDHISREVGNA
jgi:hypothetical protein